MNTSSVDLPDDEQVRTLLGRAVEAPPASRVDLAAARLRGRRRARARTAGAAGGLTLAVAASLVAVAAVEGVQLLPGTGDRAAVPAADAGRPSASAPARRAEPTAGSVAAAGGRGARPPPRGGGVAAAFRAAYEPAPGWRVLRALPCNEVSGMGAGGTSLFWCDIEVTDGVGVGAVRLTLLRGDANECARPPARPMTVDGRRVSYQEEDGMLNVPSRVATACAAHADGSVVAIWASDRSEERYAKPAGPGPWEQAPAANGGPGETMAVRPRAASLPLRGEPLGRLALDGSLTWTGR